MTGKLKPEQRWYNLILERYQAFKLSGELERLRHQALKILRRRKLLSNLEYWKLPLTEGPLAYNSEWMRQCEKVAERFGLAPWTVKMACLLENYAPEKEPYPIGAQWPSLRVVTENTDEVFQRHLFYHALCFGAHVYLERGRTRTATIFLDSCPVYGPLESPLTDSQRPPRDKAFRVEVNVPPVYPPEAAKQLAGFGVQLTRKILLRLGYPVPRRLRSTKLLPEAGKLRIGERPLSSGAAYEIIDELFPDRDLSQDQKRRKLVKSRRAKLYERIVKPYEDS